MSSQTNLSRRRFGGLLAATVGAAGTTAWAGAAQGKGKRMQQHHALIKPARLRDGDLVAIIAPGGFTDEDAIAQAVRNIESLGLRASLGANIRAVHGNYAGTVRQRLDDLHAAFADPEVKAIWAIRGGSGCISLLALLDYALIQRNPKVLIGYSDITALHLAIASQTGLVTFHGPVASSTFSDYTVTQLRNVLMTPQDSYTIPMALDNHRRAQTQPNFAIRTVHGGQATGRLTGGNLCLVSALAGTPYAADFREHILFLEEINEVPYRIDRMLCQLDLSVGFKHAAALMLGIFEHCEAAEGDTALSLDATLDQHLQPLSVPAVSGYSFGHIRHQFTLPMGILATLDADRQTLTLLEPAVC
ncbi:LD-carboxypeptidase [Janthinobacterium sp. UMAB-60]|uniref:S66 peptidase family protein n=1 Tax=Janthinobacterium sp. UMAB-60 TaxID=1365365 RepID=UPI001C58FD70|nr:LD-carboxypeptidase [Janthinobacterium sp. UMAB-60]